MSAALPLGTTVLPWGSISAVAILQGERYYFFAEKGVAMIPGYIVEKNHAAMTPQLPQREG